MPASQDIAATHLVANDPDGNALALVSFADGALGIVRNGTPIPDWRWRDDQMEECTAAFTGLAKLPPR